MERTSTEQQKSIGSDLHRLYTLSAEAEQIYELTCGEVTSETDALEQWLAEASSNTALALCCFRSEMDGRLAACYLEIERLQAVVDRTKAKIEWSKKRTLDVMRALGVRSLEVGTYHVSVRTGTEHLEEDPRSKPDIGMLQLLDESFVRVTEPKIEPNKKAILAALKAGTAVPGYLAVRGADGVMFR